MQEKVNALNALSRIYFDFFFFFFFFFSENRLHMKWQSLFSSKIRRLSSIWRLLKRVVNLKEVKQRERD